MDLILLDNLSEADLKGKTIFIRVDFNVPMVTSNQGHYRVGDDTRIRRFLDLTFKKIHDLTQGDCRIIIGSHLGRPHVKKNHSGWDGIFNIQFVSSHFDTLMRKRYGDYYTIFPPEIIGSQLTHSLEMITRYQLPVGGIKFLPNLRYLLDPDNPENYRKEFIEQVATVADVYINCAFGTNHRLTKSIQLLPKIMKDQGKLTIGGCLLREEIKQLGGLGHRILAYPDKTIVLTGGAKISDKIGILRQFVHSKIKGIFLGGKMVNAFNLAKQLESDASKMTPEDIPKKLLSKIDIENEKFSNEVKMAHDILSLAKQKNVSMIFPLDYKIVTDYQQTTYSIKKNLDMDKELQLDLGPETIKLFTNLFLSGEIENIFWNGPLGAYDHPYCEDYAEGSMELAKLLFGVALVNQKISVVIGGGDTAAILNKFKINNLKDIMKKHLETQLSQRINSSLLKLDFESDDCYKLFNNFASNFFVSTGGGASLEFMERFLKDNGKSPLASYLPGTAVLMEPS